MTLAVPGWQVTGTVNRSSRRPNCTALTKDFFGGDDGNRTHDPLLAKQVLCQLSYVPGGWRKTGRKPGPGEASENAAAVVYR